MLQIAVCDDSVLELQHMSDLLIAFAKRHPERDIKIRLFKSPFDLITCLEAKERFQIYILDIMMPKMNGIDIGEKIREGDQSAILIYLTSSPDFALKSYKVFPLQYFVKPIDEKKFFLVMDLAVERAYQEAKQSILVKTKQEMIAVKYYQIMYVEYIDHSLHFQLADHTSIDGVKSREPFEKMAQMLLSDRRFVKPHIAFVVNMNYIHSMSAKEFTLEDGSTVPIARKNYAVVKKQYIDFLLSRGGKGSDTI